MTMKKTTKRKYKKAEVVFETTPDADCFSFWYIGVLAIMFLLAGAVMATR